MEGPYNVRKGAWTEEEDILLRRFVEKRGEGKWSQVAAGAGLKRCRKSCRLRWLNYLKPSVKRGNFTGDEIDLMIRLHNLLGNRWSLIAGRLPGRTANDVKNYWNTHMHKKEISQMKNMKEKAQGIGMVKAIRPRPVNISKNLTWSPEKSTVAGNFRSEKDVNNIASTSMIPQESMNWWERLLNLAESDEKDVCCINALDNESDKIIWDKQMTLETEVWNAFNEGGPSRVEDVSLDNSLWDLFHAE